MSKLKAVMLILVLTLYCFITLSIIKQVDPPDDSQPPPATEFEKDEDVLKMSISEDPILSLSALASLSPPSPVNPSCTPPSLPTIPSCSDQPGLTGRLLDHPRKVILMMLFSFEVDVLEISLREQIDLVDRIFIVEATTTTKGASKPLMWERVGNSDRFSFVNQSKIIHVVMDDVIDRDKLSQDEWYHEKRQTSIGITRVKYWARVQGNVLDQDDVLISADVDEVMSASALNQLRWCETKQSPLFGALWMPLGSLDRAYSTEFHVPNKPHTYTQPTIYHWGDIASGRFEGQRLQKSWLGPRDKYLSGGIHMTHATYLPNLILKTVTATESRNVTINNFFTDIYRGVTLEDLNNQQMLAYKLEYVQKHLFPMNVVPMSNVTDISAYVPWFLACNRQRFPYWFGLPDPRNKDFLKYLEKQGNQEKRKLFLQEGCFDEPGKQDIPCIGTWIKVNKSLDDPGAGAWARPVKVKKELKSSSSSKCGTGKCHKSLVDKLTR